jgi:hypothetical protein
VSGSLAPSLSGVSKLLSSRLGWRYFSHNRDNQQVLTGPNIQKLQIRKLEVFTKRRGTSLLDICPPQKAADIVAFVP